MEARKKPFILKYIMFVNIVVFLLVLIYRIFKFNYMYISIVTYDLFLIFCFFSLAPILTPYFYMKKKKIWKSNNNLSKKPLKKFKIYDLLGIIFAILFIFLALIHYYLISFVFATCIGSRTTNIDNYLKCDKNLCSSDVFPDIKKYNYTDIKYEYEYSNFLGMDSEKIVKIYLEFILPDDEYASELSRISNLERAKLTYNSSNKKQFYVGVIVTFYDDSNKITYEEIYDTV